MIVTDRRTDGQTDRQTDILSANCALNYIARPKNRDCLVFTVCWNIGYPQSWTDNGWVTIIGNGWSYGTLNRSVLLWMAVAPLLGRGPALVSKVLGFTREVYLFIYQSTLLNSHAVDSHQMYFGGSVVGNASTIGREISPIPPLIFTRVKKCEIWRRLKHKTSLNFEPPAFENAARYPNSETKVQCCDDRCVPAKFGEVGSTHPWESSVSCDPPSKIVRENVLNRQ